MILTVIGTILLVKSASARSVELLVGAASSLKESVSEVCKSFEASHPQVKILVTFAASGILMAQVKQGAPIDVIACASTEEVERLATIHLVNKSQISDFVGNRLVLIAGQSSPVTSLNNLMLARHIAISNPRTVPSGRYAVNTLRHQKLLPALEGRLVYGENVRQALTTVESGDAEAGFVYATDALSSQKVRVIWTAQPGIDHEPIVYRAAVVSASSHAALSAEFLRYLNSPLAQRIFKKFGFTQIWAQKRAS